MKNIKSILVGLGLTASFALAGCGGDGNAVSVMKDIKEKVCACKDLACATKVMEEMKNMKDPKAPSKDDMEKVTKIMGEMQTCMAKLTPLAPKPE